MNEFANALEAGAKLNELADTRDEAEQLARLERRHEDRGRQMRRNVEAIERETTAIRKMPNAMLREDVPVSADSILDLATRAENCGAIETRDIAMSHLAARIEV